MLEQVSRYSARESKYSIGCVIELPDPVRPALSLSCLWWEDLAQMVNYFRHNAAKEEGDGGEAGPHWPDGDQSQVRHCR